MKYLRYEFWGYLTNRAKNLRGQIQCTLIVISQYKANNDSSCTLFFIFYYLVNRLFFNGYNLNTNLLSVI